MLSVLYLMLVPLGPYKIVTLRIFTFLFFYLINFRLSSFTPATVGPAILLLLIRLNFLVSGTYTHSSGERYEFSPSFRVIKVDKMFHRDLYMLVSIACTISFDFYVAINYSVIKSIYLL